MIDFANPFFLLLFLLIPLLYFAQWLYLKWRQNILKKIGDQEVVEYLILNFSARRQKVKLHLRAAAIAFFILALAGPVIPGEEVRPEKTGGNIIFILDTSLSMLAEDVFPNRLEKGKYIISQVVGNQSSRQIGLIVYSGIAYPLVPLTLDYKALQNSLQTVKANMLSVPGTSLGEAVRLASLFSNSNSQLKNQVFILSDGEEHTDAIKTALDTLDLSGMQIFSVGLGTYTGGKIPISLKNGMKGVKAGPGKEAVISTLNDSFLKIVAKRTGGQYIHINHSQEGTSFILSNLELAERNSYLASTVINKEPVYQWVLLIGLLMLLADFFYREGHFKP